MIINASQWTRDNDGDEFKKINQLVEVVEGWATSTTYKREYGEITITYWWRGTAFARLVNGRNYKKLDFEEDQDCDGVRIFEKVL